MRFWFFEGFYILFVKMFNPAKPAKRLHKKDKTTFRWWMDEEEVVVKTLNTLDEIEQLRV